MQTNFIKYINHKILKDASSLKYTVANLAPDSLNTIKAQSLIIWSGASDNTIYNDAVVNYAFRALHDALHIKTGLDFSPDHEIEIGRIQASKYDGIMADLVYAETAGQALYYKINGIFLLDQTSFTRQYLINLGYKI